MSKAFATCTLVLMLAGCAASSSPELPPTTVPGIDPRMGQPADPALGLNGLEPDVCKAAVYSSLIGQPAAAVASAGITVPVRVIPLGGMVTEDYSSSRINFYLDGTGNIAKITCG